MIYSSKVLRIVYKFQCQSPNESYYQCVRHLTERIGEQIAEAVAQRCSVKKVFLEISQNSQESNCARIWHRCFSVNFGKFLRTPFLTEHLRWLLLRLVFHPQPIKGNNRKQPPDVFYKNRCS